MRLFYLDREIDDSGVSGIGRVAEGVKFDDGVCVLHWIVGEVRSTTVYNTTEEMIKIHGHGNHTHLTWVGEEIDEISQR